MNHETSFIISDVANNQPLQHEYGYVFLFQEYADATKHCCGNETIIAWNDLDPAWRKEYIYVFYNPNRHYETLVRN